MSVFKVVAEELADCELSIMNMLNEVSGIKNESIENVVVSPDSDREVAGDYKYDVFISHASDNKKAFVDSLREKLGLLGIRVWYDTSNIEWGDDWKLKILEGLKKCRFGIVVLSPEFMGHEWTEKELSELLSRQDERQEKVILPLLYNLTVEEMKKRYPNLASIQARIVHGGEDAKDVVIDFARILIRSLR